MKQLYRLFFVGLILVLATSCRRSMDSLSIPEAESRLSGEWTMTKVRNNVRGDGKWGKEDVSGNFRNWQFNFLPDRTLELYIPDEDLNLVGSWELYEDWESDSDGDSELTTYLYIYAYNPNDLDEWREFVWEDMRIAGDTFLAKEEIYISGERVFYHYELKR